MRDHEIIELYWARNESAITATAEKYGSYCHTIAYNIGPVDKGSKYVRSMVE